jgi:cytochrome c2
MLDAMLTEMQWTRERLDAFLTSPSSPLRGRTQLRTVGDVNRVLWALKRIAARQARGSVQK